MRSARAAASGAMPSCRQGSPPPRRRTPSVAWAPAWLRPVVGSRRGPRSSGRRRVVDRPDARLARAGPRRPTFGALGNGASVAVCGGRQRDVLGSELRSEVVTNPEREFVTACFDDLRADLDAWLRIPSISADPAHASDVARSAEWLAEALRRAGFPTVETWPTPGAPAVYAEWPSADPGAPVALVYGHHDVQPVDPLELWGHPPVEPAGPEGPG